jgi:hypothetical protein
MKFFTTRKAIVATISTLAIVASLGGAAYAYWTSSGSGTGSAKTGVAATTLQITDLTNITDMAPGVAAESINGSIQNTAAVGGQSDFVNTVTVSISGVTETAAELLANPGYTCSSADYNLSGAIMTVATNLAPQASHAFSGATIGFNSTAVDQDACQGATVSLAYVTN